VLYASWFPFAGWRWPPGQELAPLLALPWPPWRDEFDLWANTLGYAPLGFLLFVAVRRSGGGTLAAALAAVLGAAGLSYLAEVVQHFLPGRHPSLKDWAANVGGAAAGALLAGAVSAAGGIDRWVAFRERWFGGGAAGALALLALWPVGLLFPAPAPFALGQVGPVLRETALALVEGVPWLARWQALLAAPPGVPPLPTLAEAAASTLGLLAPIGIACAVVAPGWRRLVLALGAAALGVLGMALSSLLNFGPENAWAWVMPETPLAIGAALVAAVLLVWVPARVAAGLALVVLAALVAIVALAPPDPYFALRLQAWEQGRFVRFHGLAQWVARLWPFAAIAWLLLWQPARRPG
jgi:VanZ family protein